MRARTKVVSIGLGLASAVLLSVAFADEEDPFAAGADALAVNADDGSASLRAKKKLRKLGKEMLIVRVKSLDDSGFPDCTFTAQILKAAQAKEKHFKVLLRGKTYRFAPVLHKKRGKVVLEHKLNQNNLGACYYPPKTRLVVKVGGVDLKKKLVNAAEIYLK